MKETLQKLEEIITKMSATGYGEINIEIKKGQVFINSTYKDKINLTK